VTLSEEAAAAVAAAPSLFLGGENDLVVSSNRRVSPCSVNVYRKTCAMDDRGWFVSRISLLHNKMRN
jgi:hypothetical protein